MDGLPLHLREHRAAGEDQQCKNQSSSGSRHQCLHPDGPVNILWQFSGSRSTGIRMANRARIPVPLAGLEAMVKKCFVVMGFGEKTDLGRPRRHRRHGCRRTRAPARECDLRGAAADSDRRRSRQDRRGADVLDQGVTDRGALRRRRGDPGDRPASLRLVADAPERWMADTMNEQLAKLQALLAAAPAA